MTSSAPIDRMRSSFDVLATPVTRAPNAFAICTANVPTPPAAPTTSTDCPARTRALSRTAWSAVTPETGTAAACSKVSRAGLETSLSARAIAYSAKEPGATPITSSPGWNPVTFGPTASTVPATSHPRTRSFGPRNPITGRAMYGCPVIRCHTSGPAPAACTRTSTSFSPATGSSTSRSSSTSAEPYLSCTIAFIAPPPSRCTPYTCWPYTRCTTYTCQPGGPAGSSAGSEEEKPDGHEDRGEGRSARAPDQGADPADRRPPGRRGWRRVPQHAEDRAGARRRADGALQARRQQGRDARRDGRRHRRRDRPAARRRRLEDRDPRAGALGPQGAPPPPVGLTGYRVADRSDADGDRVHGRDDRDPPEGRLLGRPDPSCDACDREPGPGVLAGAVRRHAG